LLWHPRQDALPILFERLFAMAKKLANKYSAALLIAFWTSICVQNGQSFAEDITALGTVTVTTTIKRQNSDCVTINECEIGKPCFSNITIEGPSAKQLYDGLKQHGTKYNDAADADYVGTQSDDFTCWNNDETYVCYFGYDGRKNVISSPLCNED
jgi:hypothetical protein